MKIRIRVSLVFTAIMLLMVGAMLVGGLGYPWNVKLAPYAVGIPTLVLLIILFLRELNPAWKMGGTQKSEEEPENKEDSDFTTWGPVLNLFGWLFGFFAAVFFFGFMVATPVFLAGFLRRKAGVGWIGSVASGVLCTALSAWFVQELFNIDLWLGAVPKLVPGILGGSIVPPL